MNLKQGAVPAISMCICSLLITVTAVKKKSNMKKVN